MSAPSNPTSSIPHAGDKRDRQAIEEPPPESDPEVRLHDAHARESAANCSI